MLGAYVFDEKYIVLNRTERLLLYLGDVFMANEKREVITMEDLKNSDRWEDLNDLLNQIETCCKLINKIQELENSCAFELQLSFRDKVDRCRGMLSARLSELGTEFLLCKLDDDVRKYINDRLEECYE